MATYVEAVFEHGAFVPDTPFDLPDGTRVLLTVQPRAGVAPPSVPDAEERAQLLRALVEDMKGNPVPPSAPRFTRDELHERR
jgi:predicted DNA-binding antitoxin AbrB/MazE fold protein